jgi:hypothetical protein
VYADSTTRARREHTQRHGSRPNFVMIARLSRVEMAKNGRCGRIKLFSSDFDAKNAPDPEKNRRR